MSRHIKQEFHDDLQGVIWCQCTSCNGETRHKVKRGAETEGHISDGGFDYHWLERHQIIQCQGCLELSFRYETENSEDIVQTGPYEHGPEVTVEMYPPRTNRITGLPDAHFLPAEIYGIYAETLNVLRNGQLILAGVGIRATIETVCRHQNASGSLNVMIDHLVASGALREREADLLHRLRFMGNAAAHAAKPHALAVLTKAFEVVEQILINLYLLEIRASDIPKSGNS